MYRIIKKTYSLGGCVIATVALLTTALSSNAWSASYQDAGYYTGAFGTVGEHGCDGASGQGINPTGGCTPGDFPLIRSTTVANSVRFTGGVSSATADLAHGSLEAATNFPVNPGQLTVGWANLFDTFTVVGDLSVPQTLTLTMLVNSSVSGHHPPESNPATFVNARALVVDRFSGLSTQLQFLRADRCAGSDATLCHTDYGDDAVSLTASGPVLLDDTHRIFTLDAFLNAVSGGGQSDHVVSALATISLAVPAGLSLVSASGVFPTTTVPLPPSVLMLASSLAAMGMTRRRRGPSLKVSS